MKIGVGLAVVAFVIFSCEKTEVVSSFTGKQTTYVLQAGSAYDISGTATFKERTDGAVTISVKLKGTSDGTTSPVHLHLGDITTPQAGVAALLSPVIGKTGESETVLTRLADESLVTYTSLMGLKACVKVHLWDVGPEKDIILAAGNIGTSLDKANPGGRLGVSVCSTETKVETTTRKIVREVRWRH